MKKPQMAFDLSFNLVLSAALDEFNSIPTCQYKSLETCQKPMATQGSITSFKASVLNKSSTDKGILVSQSLTINLLSTETLYVLFRSCPRSPEA